MLILHERKELSHSDWLFVCKLKTNLCMNPVWVCIVSDQQGVNFLTQLVRANIEAVTLPK